MRTEGAIQYKLKQVCYRHRKKLIEERLRPSPSNCIFNDIPIYEGEISAYRVCCYDGEEDWGGLVCDDEVGGSLLAKRCRFFRARETAEEIKAEFSESLKKDALGVIAAKYPDIAALMWVLEATPEAFMDETEDEQEPPTGDVSSTE
jgi:hypothetical protein